MRVWGAGICLQCFLCTCQCAGLSQLSSGAFSGASLLPSGFTCWRVAGGGFGLGKRLQTCLWYLSWETSDKSFLPLCTSVPLFLKWRDYYSEILMGKFTLLWMPMAPEMMSDMVFLNCNFILLKKYPGTLKIEIKSNYKILYYKYIKFNTLNVNQNNDNIAYLHM